MLDNALLGLSEHYLDHCDPMFPGQGSGAASPSSQGLDLVLFRVPLRLLGLNDNNKKKIYILHFYLANAH